MTASGMPGCRLHGGCEPSLSDMVADPIVLALMASDGVSRATLDRLIGVVRANLAKRGTERDAERCAAPAAAIRPGLLHRPEAEGGTRSGGAAAAARAARWAL